jgi:hypothetical protein
MFRKLIFAGIFFALLAACVPARAQQTLVTGTVVDPNGIPYAGATLKLSLVPSGAGNYFWTGGTQAQCVAASAGSAPCKIPFTPSSAPIALDGTGSFTTSLYPNGQISPAGTHWAFQININAPPPLGVGPVEFSLPITIVGASQSVSATLTAAAPSLIAFTIVPGGVPCVTTPLSLQYNNAGAFGCVDVATYTPHTLTMTANADASTPLAILPHSAGQTAPLLSFGAGNQPAIQFADDANTYFALGYLAPGSQVRFVSNFSGGGVSGIIINDDTSSVPGEVTLDSEDPNSILQPLNVQASSVIPGKFPTNSQTLGCAACLSASMAPFQDVFLGALASTSYGHLALPASFSVPRTITWGGDWNVVLPKPVTATPGSCFDGLNGTTGAFTTESCSGALPTLPTTPNGVSQSLQSTPAGGVGQPAAWNLPGVVSRVVGGTTATDTILSTDCSQRVDYQGSVAVATALPTATTLAVPGCLLILDNDTVPASVVTVTPATWTFYGGATSLAIQSGWGCAIFVDPAGTVWDTHCGPSAPGPFNAGVGSASSPTYNFAGYPNYGMSMDSSNMLGLFGNGNLGFEVDNLGRLHVASSFLEFYSVAAGNGCYMNGTSGSSPFFEETLNATVGVCQLDADAIGAAVGSQFAGTCTFTGGTTCSIVYTRAYTNTPVVVITPINPGAVLFTLTSTANTGFTVTGSVGNAIVVNYIVIGNPD